MQHGRETRTEGRKERAWAQEERRRPKSCGLSLRPSLPEPIPSPHPSPKGGPPATPRALGRRAHLDGLGEDAPEGLRLGEEHDARHEAEQPHHQEGKQREVHRVRDDDDDRREDPADARGLGGRPDADVPHDRREELSGEEDDDRKGRRGAALCHEGEPQAHGPLRPGAEDEARPRNHVRRRDGPSAPDPLDQHGRHEVRGELDDRQNGVVGVDAAREIRHHEGDAVVHGAHGEPREELHEQAVAEGPVEEDPAHARG
mmetsp:Transcript_34455/g.81650  ORF Transcript_34455/g.81650 Transcript_34455/m.81650 type:complete len:258 (+) Transcript_34455:910-1683(+)